MKANLYILSILLSLIYLFYDKANAQAPDWSWAKSIGSGHDDAAKSIVIDPSGNIYATGSYSGTADFDPGAGIFNLTSFGIFISKLDASGNFVWAKALKGAQAEGSSIAIDAFGSVYITGYFSGTIDFDPDSSVNFNLTSTAFSYDIFICKLDSAGNFVWAKQIGGSNYDWGTSIVLDSSGNVYTTGMFDGTVDFNPDTGIFNLTSAGANDIFISKLDNSGNFIWARAMGGTNADYGESIALDPSGNLYTTGIFAGTADFDPDSSVSFNLTGPGLYSHFISKLNSSGNFLWAKAITGGDIGGMSIAVDATGNVYTTGSIEGGADFDPGVGVFPLVAAGSKDDFISKLDSSGNFVWAKLMGGSGSLGAFGYSIALDASGNIYSSGCFYNTVDFDPGIGSFNLTSGTGADIFLSKLDNSGNFVWAKSMGGALENIGYSVTIDATGRVYLAGSFKSPTISFDFISLINADSVNNHSDIFIAKLDSLSTGIQSVKNDNGISVYPNPARESLVVNYPLLENSKVIITITDITGKVIYSNATTEAQKEVVDISNFHEGIYLVHIDSNDFTGTKIFIVEK